MLARVYSSAVIGIDAYIVEVEVDISQGLPYVTFFFPHDVNLDKNVTLTKS